ncbi:MAG: MATE family efflux transporter [Clostridiales bacterium]|nr:MATE family efflux transporter [Clostridiales bacterium]
MFSNKDLKRLLIPLTIEQLLMSLMGTVGTIMVSNVGPASLSAVSLVDSINVLVIFLFSALATGGTIVCSQYLGKGDKDAAKNSSYQLMGAVLGLSTVITILCFILRRSLLQAIFGTVDADVMEESLVYFTITMMSFPFIAMNNASSALYRATGNSKLPMMVSLGANILNLAGNAILIFGFQLGVAGSATATLISRIAGALLMLWFQTRPDQLISLDNIRAFKPDFAVIRLILRIGIPAGLENCLFQIGKLLVQSTVSTLGTKAISIQAMVYTLEYLSSIPSMAVGLGMMTVVGHCMGAGKPEEARRYTIKLTKLGTAALAASLAFMVLITRPVTTLAGMDNERAAITFQLILLIAAVKMFLWPLAFIPAYGMRAAGDVKYLLLVSSISMWVLRVGLTWLFCRHFGAGVTGVWIAWFTDWLCRSIFFFLRFNSGKWMQKKVLA